jgi:acyl-CoA oxidase
MAAAWGQTFQQHTADLPALGANLHYTKSADRLRRLLREGPLKLTDLVNEPERFFKAHDVLSGYATDVGPGFGIRFTVQFNLFAGTVLALGSPEHVKLLDKFQAEGKLGCFCLTEVFAGVNSGLVVNTTAVWDEGRSQFLIDCPDHGARKNWISQGLTADVAVVVANLFVKGKACGPHGFLMDLRDSSGKLMDGVSMEDMGDKTIGNDLDNARINFSKIWLPKNALLDRFGGISDAGDYVQRQQGVSNADMILQRLYTGRTVIAGSTLIFSRSLYKRTREYADKKQCWIPKGKLSLSDVPQLASLYQEADEQLRRVEALQADVEKNLSHCLRNNVAPGVDLVEKVSALKVKAIETSIDVCFRLKQEVGSYALMAGTGFERMDYLQCCKFAEGDSRILMQKMARDRLQAFAKDQKASDAEAHICQELGQKMMTGGKTAWVDNWKLVYALADAVINRVIADAAPSSKL